MATPSFLLTEEQFLCSICLDVFTEPVAIPCGHNFCRACIRMYWDSNDQCQCPMCKKTFERRPDLFINTFISEMASQFKKSVLVKATGSKPCPAKSGEVSCDICIGTKLKAFKSCLMCLTSYCEIHLEPHQRVVALKKHNLINPVDNLEDRICKKHDKTLELFCESDQTYVCVSCLNTDHVTHKIVPIEQVYGARMAELGRIMAQVQQMMHERALKVKEIKHSMDLSKKNTEKSISDCNNFFTALVSSIKKSQADLVGVIQKEQKAGEMLAERLIKELEQEITELNKRSTDLEKLTHSEDHLHLLQSFPSLSTPPHTKDWSEISVHSDLCVGTVRSAVLQLSITLSEEINREMNRLCVAELKIMQKSSVDLTLDPDTAHSYLILSDNGKQVRSGNTKQNVLDNPKRFDSHLIVLAKEGFKSGRFYYEVQVQGKPAWGLGVVKESVNRKNALIVTPGSEHWTMWLYNNNLELMSDPSVSLVLKDNPQRVGVFVDYEKGQVSFYDAEAASHIYTFTGCTFVERLYPFFSPHLNEDGTNSDPLIICSGNHTN